MLHDIAYDFWLEIHRECENRHVHTFLSNINGIIKHYYCHFIKVKVSVMTILIERTFIDVLHNFMIRVFSYRNLTL